MPKILILLWEKKKIKEYWLNRLKESVAKIFFFGNSLIIKNDNNLFLYK